MSREGFIGGVAVATVAVVGSAFALFCTERIPAGYVGVQYSVNGGVQDEVLSQGWHIVSPMTKVTEYTVGLEQSYLTSDEKGDSKDDESFSASSKEGKELIIDLTFSYQFKESDVVNVFNKFKGKDGELVRDTFIKPNIVSWSKEVIAKYPVASVLGEQRASINKDLTEYLSKKFKSYGITISNVSLINVDVDKQTKEAINKKIKAQQDAETQKIKNQTSIDKANAKVEKARADAEAKKIKAEAEANANREIAQSLSKELIDYKKMEKWDGQLPKYQGTEVGMFIQD